MPSRVLLLTVEGHAADHVTRTLEGRGLAVTVARDLPTALKRMADHQMIVLDARDAASVALLCRRINDETGRSHPPVLAIAHSDDVDARVALLEAGADDVLAQPIDDRELEALAEALLMRSGSARGTPDGLPGVGQRVQTGPGRVIAFCAAKGGSGTTTLAVNTALLLAEMAPGSVAIADLDFHHGQVSTHLDLYGSSSTATLAREDVLQSPELIAEAARQHPSGLTVFGGPYRPDEGLNVTVAQLDALVEALRSQFPTLVVDAGSGLDMRLVPLLNRADRVVMSLTPDIPSLRLLHALLQVLSEAGNAPDRAVFVVNDIFPRQMIGAEQIEEHLGIRVGLEIPHDAEHFLKAVNEGQPIVGSARRSAAAGAIRRLAPMLADPEAEEEAGQAQRRGLLRGLLGRS